MKIMAKGKFDTFYGYKEACGCYPLYSKALKQKTNLPIHHKENKELISSIEVVKEKVSAGTHHMRLQGAQSKAKNVFSPGSIVIIG